MTDSTDELGPAEGLLRTMLDLATVRGWRVVWKPTEYLVTRGGTSLPKTLPHYAVHYKVDGQERARMIAVNDRGAQELQGMLEYTDDFAKNYTKGLAASMVNTKEVMAANLLSQVWSKPNGQ